MIYKVVVARYNENIQWLQPIKSHCIIYNKGESLGIPNEIPLENKGRESETYVRFIIDHYHKLPDVVIFTQANISDHRGKNHFSYLLKIGKEAAVKGKSRPDIVHSHTKEYSDWNPDWNLKNGKYYLEDCYFQNQPKLFSDWFREHIVSTFPNPIKIYPNGIFAVRKDFIQRRPLDYYQSLISQVNHHVNATEGHFFERSWYYIFE